ncbi:MAG: hypothetical protein ACRDM8_04485 [Gaiellaceae bacterium]|jgi:hypothetical protein
MGLGATVGADLLAVPFPKMVLSLAQAIAKGQLALDQASLNTLKVLAKTKFDYIPEITEVLSPSEDINAGGVTVTGVDVELITPRALKLTLLQAGIVPTFYQFTESVIEVKMSISSKVESQSEFEFGIETEASAGFLFASGSVSSHVNFKTSNTFSYSAEGSSLLRTTLKPTPPPSRMMPRFITVNTLVQPPTVTFSE